MKIARWRALFSPRGYVKHDPGVDEKKQQQQRKPSILKSFKRRSKRNPAVSHDPPETTYATPNPLTGPPPDPDPNKEPPPRAPSLSSSASDSMGSQALYLTTTATTITARALPASPPSVLEIVEPELGSPPLVPCTDLEQPRTPYPDGLGLSSHTTEQGVPLPQVPRSMATPSPSPRPSQACNGHIQQEPSQLVHPGSIEQHTHMIPRDQSSSHGLEEHPTTDTSHRESSNETISSDPPSEWVISEFDDESEQGTPVVVPLNLSQFPPRRPMDPLIREDSRRSVVEKIMAVLPHLTHHVDHHELEEPAIEPMVSLQSVDDPTKILKVPMREITIAWRDYQNAKANTRTIRSRLRRLRKDIQELRGMVKRAEQLNAPLRSQADLSEKNHHHHHPHQTLQQGLSKLGEEAVIPQGSKTMLQNSEIEYEKLEDQLDEVEDSESSLELTFWNLLTHGTRDGGEKRDPAPYDASQRGGPDHRSDAKVAKVPNDLMGISPDGPEDQLHPALRQLLKAKAELRLYQEEQRELLLSKALREDELLRVRERKTDGALRYILDFLDEFPSMDTSIKASINETESKVHRLEGVCRDKNIKSQRYTIDENGLTDVMLEDVEDLDADTDLDGDEDGQMHSNYPVLLSQAHHLLSGDEPLTPYANLKKAVKLPDGVPGKQETVDKAVREYEIEKMMTTYVDEDGQGKAGQIQRWILQHLRQSPLQAFILLMTFISSHLLRIENFEQWQLDVLYYWPKDDTADIANRHFKKQDEASLHYTLHPESQPPGPASEDNTRQKRSAHRHAWSFGSVWTLGRYEIMEARDVVEYPKPSVSNLKDDHWRSKHMHPPKGIPKPPFLSLFSPSEILPGHL